MVFSISNSKCVKALLGTLMFCLLGVGQAFAVEKWTDDAIEPPQENGIYQVSTPGQLAWFALNSIGTESSAKIKLVADLDLKGKLWLPIGTGNKEPGFQGEFDGDGHTIKNLYIRSEELLEEYSANVGGNNCVAQNLGLFGISHTGFIKNVNLENISIYATNSHINGCGNEISVGGLVGWKTTKGSLIDKVIVSGMIYTSGKAQGVGGIVGNAHSSTISNSVSMVNITADGDSAFVGGIVGLVKNNEVKIDSCVYAGTKLESNGSGGKSGAVAGRVYKGNAKANMKDVYYDSDIFDTNAVGVVGPSGQGGSVTGKPSAVSNLNTEEVVCMLNKGTLDENGECDTQSPWSVGGQSISWNGSDGYKVTFDANGGTFPENSKTYKMLSNGNAITADEITSPNKTGASFAGWSLTKGASEPSDLGIVSAPTRVYAVWKPVFTITFNANGGNFPDGSSTKGKSVAQGDVITVEGIGALPESYCKVPSDEECDDAMYFTGWSFNPNPSTESEIVDLNQLNVFASKDTTLYAIWTEVITYTVTFNAGGHGKTKVNFVRVGAGENITQPVDPTADVGYTFDGWFTENGTKFIFETTSITESIILYAHWTPMEYAITYMLGDDCTNDPDNPPTYTLETQTFEFKAPSRAGYTFEKWYYDENFSSPATQITKGTTTGAKTLYANWIPNVYTIEYRVGSVGQGTVLLSEKDHGQPINLKLINDGFTRNGYTQTGWTTTDGGEKVYESGALYEENHDLTLFPTWDTATYTITYVCDGCTDVNNRDSYTMFDDADLKFNKPKFPGNNQYLWVAWYQDANFTKQIQTIKKGSYGDTTIYAKLLKYYNLTYELNGRKVKANNAVRYHVESTVELKAPDPASIDGYIFDGWYDNANFEGNAVTEIVKGTTGDMTLYAKWVPISYTITYELNGGTNAEGNPESYTIEDLPIDLLDPVKTGYEFDGWYYNSDFSGDQVSGIYTLGSDVDVTLYAKWEKVYPFLVNDFGAIKVYEDENGKLTAEIDGMSTGDVSTISPEDNVLVSSINFSREFPVNETESDKMYSTIVLPFSIEKSKVPSADFYELKAVDVPNATVEFWTTKETLQANTPYIIRTYASTLSFNLDGDETVALNTSELNNPKSDDGAWEFRGTYSYRKWQEGDADLGRAYGFRGNARDSYSIGSFARIGAGAAIRPFRAYLLKVANQQARRYTLAKSSVVLNTASIGEETIPSSLDVVIVDRETEQTTVIGKLNTATGEIKIIDNWFDMKGRKLNSKPTAKGIYYYNGKRVMVK